MKIQPSRGKSLCASCKHSLVVETEGNETKVWCNQGYEGKIRIREVITKCNMHEVRDGSISLSDMYDMAWTLNTNKKGVLGFRAPEDKKK